MECCRSPWELHLVSENSWISQSFIQSKGWNLWPGTLDRMLLALTGFNCVYIYIYAVVKWIEWARPPLAHNESPSSLIRNVSLISTCRSELVEKLSMPLSNRMCRKWFSVRTAHGNDRLKPKTTTTLCTTNMTLSDHKCTKWKWKSLCARNGEFPLWT